MDVSGALLDFRADLQHLLAGYGFDRVDAAGTPDVLVHARDVGGRQHYVRVEVSTEPRDKPWQLLVSLGEGSLDMPERDWNGLPLSSLVERRSGSAPDYEYATTDELSDALGRVVSDLDEHASDFLQGDLTEFWAQRAKLNESRAPYTAYRMDPATGDVEASIEPQSARLKWLYSRRTR